MRCDRAKNAGFTLLTLLLVALMSGGAQALAAATPRPRIGLVLGGGGARGAAHIGVLEVLERLRVPVDCVVGTSMGALVSGVFAAGRTPAEMRTELAMADWDDLFQDNPPYSEVNYRNKTIATRFMPGSEMGITDKGVAYQSGVVAGEKLKLFFNRLVRADLGERNIEALPLPLSIIATDIGNGTKVVLRDGSLTNAMRASMSVPGLMTPFDHQGHKLVDGGLVDNVPIDEARARCKADIVIAVNVGSPLLNAADVGSLFTVSAQMVNILTEQNVTYSLASLKPTDIYIKPDLEGITAGDFKKSSETADRGRVAAETVAERLKAFSVSEADYAQWRKKILYAPQEPQAIDEIQIAEMKTVNPVALERHLRAGPGEVLKEGRLNRDLLRAYGDGWYQTVDYALLSVRDRRILRVLPVEKPWGPDYLRLGMSLNSDFQQETSFTLRGAYDKTWINRLGAELIVAGEVGQANAVLAEFYQPMEATQRYFVDTALGYGSADAGVYQNNENVANYDIKRGIAALGVGVNVGLLGQVRGGWRQTWLTEELGTGVPSAVLPATSHEAFGSAYVMVDFDQLDRLYFPTRGWSSSVAYFNSPSGGYSKIFAQLIGVHSLGDFVFNLRLRYQGSLSSSLPAFDAGALGGLNNLAGFAQNELVGDDISYAGLRIERIIGRFPMGLRGDIRLGAALETGKIGTPYTETKVDGWTNSGSLYLGGETPVGPTFLGYGRSDTGADSFYLFLGTP